MANHKEDREFLLQGLEEIQRPSSGSFEVLSVFGPEAFPLLVGDLYGHKSAHAGASRFGEGRIIIYTNDDYLKPLEGGIKTLLLNNVKWSTNSMENPKAGVFNSPELKSYLEKEGVNASEITLNTLNEYGSLMGFDLLFIRDIYWVTSRSHIENLKKFVISGGGLILSGKSSGRFGTSIRTEHVGNQLSAEAGLLWTARSGVDPLTDPNSDKDSTKVSEEFLNEATVEGFIDLRIVPVLEKKLKPSKTELFSLEASFKDRIKPIPYEDQLLLPNALSKLEKVSPIPTGSKPVKDSTEKLGIKLQCDLINILVNGGINMSPNPVCAVFPGIVPENAPRISDRKVQLKVNKSKVPPLGGYIIWYSTGLYASPGELIQFVFPSKNLKKKVKVQIGCHNDDCSQVEDWLRHPIIVFPTTKFEIGTQEQRISLVNPFGGLIYITTEVDDNDNEDIQVSISGGVEAPYFLVGETTKAEWVDRIRSLEAPWAELANSKVILTVPSENIRKLEDPEALMKVWEEILDAEADLAAISRDRRKPERFVADVSISGGLMHAGYPIMYFNYPDLLEISVTAAKLKSAEGWGHFHELGHNHQQYSWTWYGMSEVTCNIFSMHVKETVCGYPVTELVGSKTKAEVREMIETFIKGGKKYSDWALDNWFSLLFFYQLRLCFGWDAYKKVFEAYQHLSEEENPNRDQYKSIDLWLKKFSNAVGKNLAPFYQSWGLPLSEAAIAAVAHLPSPDPEIKMEFLLD